MKNLKHAWVGIAVFSLSGAWAGTQCEDFSHLRPTGLGVTVTYKQVGCEKFVKTFVDDETRETILVQQAPFTEIWNEEIHDAPADYYTVKQRFVLGVNGKRLFEEQVIDGRAKIEKHLRTFYRTRSEVLRKLPSGEIEKTGFDFHRYEYGDGSIEFETKPTQGTFAPAS